MRWIKLNSKPRSRFAAIAMCAVALAALSLLSAKLLSAPAESENHITVFGPQGRFNLKTIASPNGEYVNLVAALAQCGSVASSRDGAKLKLRFGGISALFEDGKRSAKIGRNSVLLPDVFQISDDSALLSIRSLVEVLPRFLNEKVDYHEAPRRLFIGNSGIRFNAELKKSPSALIFTFSGRVSPQISVEGGKMRLLFSRDGVSMATESWRFNDPLITSAAYDEKSTELTVTAAEPLLASFGDGGRTISIALAPKIGPAPIAPSSQPVIAPAPQPPATNAPNDTTAPATPTPSAPAQAGDTAIATASNTRVYILLDAAHGGNEPGASFSDSLAEKDVTLAIARRLRTELENHGVTCALIRDSDATLSLDQRAAAANAGRPALYLSIHAGALGNGLRIYNAVLAPHALSAGFQPWETAQAGYVTASHAVGSSLIDSMSKSSFPFPVALLPAPVRPLNNIAGPALAVEVAPRNGDVASLGNASYQQEVAAALAAAIAGAAAHTHMQALAGTGP